MNSRSMTIELRVIHWLFPNNFKSLNFRVKLMDKIMLSMWVMKHFWDQKCFSTLNSSTETTETRLTSAQIMLFKQVQSITEKNFMETLTYQEDLLCFQDFWKDYKRTQIKLLQIEWSNSKHQKSKERTRFKSRWQPIPFRDTQYGRGEVNLQPILDFPKSIIADRNIWKEVHQQPDSIPYSCKDLDLCLNDYFQFIKQIKLY